jgi:aminoglycoside/hydroxyurea antibiotic resistance kinase
MSLVVPVRRVDGAPAVLKINFPEPESKHEADALARWNGAGAVHLLARDDERRALLAERCVPGRQLWEVDELQANEIAAGVLSQLWQAPPDGPFRSLADEAARWAAQLPRIWDAARRPFEQALLDEAVEFLRIAPPMPEGAVVLHQDLHGGTSSVGTRMACDRPEASRRRAGVRHRLAPARPPRRADRGSGCRRAHSRPARPFQRPARPRPRPRARLGDRACARVGVRGRTAARRSHRVRPAPHGLGSRRARSRPRRRRLPRQ